MFYLLVMLVEYFYAFWKFSLFHAFLVHGDAFYVVGLSAVWLCCVECGK